MVNNKQWAILIGIITLIIVMGIALSFAQEIPQPAYLTASWYSIQSLKDEGTWKRSKGVMANGELFDENRLTCATNLYPLNTLLCITNIQNGKSVVVVVKDRIAKRYGKTRIDLAKGAFLALDELKKGVIRVRVEKVARNGI